MGPVEEDLINIDNYLEYFCFLKITSARNRSPENEIFHRWSIVSYLVWSLKIHLSGLSLKIYQYQLI